MREFVAYRVILSAFAVVAAAYFLGACAAIETTISPKSYAANTQWDTYRNNSILLNIARASHSAPLQFMSFGSYSAQGKIDASFSAQLVYGAGETQSTKTLGPLAGSTGTSNTLNFLPLETDKFYRGMLTEVSAEELYYLRRQGIPRELIFHVLIDSVKIWRPNGVSYEFRNDPTDNHFTTRTGVEQNSPQCASVGDTIPFGSAIWSGIHDSDCHYEKFANFVTLALKFGLTVEAREINNPEAASNKTASKKAVKWNLCYDAAVARENNFRVQHSACGQRTEESKIRNFEFKDPRTGKRIIIGKISPEFRSPIGAFRYLGGLLATGTSETVLMRSRESIDPQTQDTRILNVLPSLGSCFAEAEYLGRSYCVPAEGAKNTKNVFSLLTALVALHTSRDDLPPPSTFILQR
jgi:hypothetical protein